MKTNQRSQDGFSLIEVLIALLILALALLGMLGVIINSLKYTSSSNYRTIAAQHANAMAEVLRANPATLDTNDATAAASFASVASGFNTTAPTVTLNCMREAGCGGSSRNNFVNHSFASWQANVQAALPAGVGFVCRDSDPVANEAKIRPNNSTPWDCNNTGAYVIKVCWDESRIAASAPNLSAGLFCTWTVL